MRLPAAIGTGIEHRKSVRLRARGCIAYRSPFDPMTHAAGSTLGSTWADWRQTWKFTTGLPLSFLQTGLKARFKKTYFEMQVQNLRSASNLLRWR